VTGPGADAAAGLPDGMGARLRRERERRDLTEQQAAEQLNLDPSVIRALEADDYAALGVAVFAKGHLRRFGALLGIPDAELLEAFEQSREQLHEPTLVPRSREEMLPVRTRPKFYVPQWLYRRAVRAELPGMLRALRKQAESTPGEGPRRAGA